MHAARHAARELDQSRHIVNILAFMSRLEEQTKAKLTMRPETHAEAHAK